MPKCCQQLFQSPKHQDQGTCMCHTAPQTGLPSIYLGFSGLFSFLLTLLYFTYLSSCPTMFFMELCHNHCNFSVCRERLFLHSTLSRTVKSELRLCNSQVFGFSTATYKDKMLFQVVPELAVTFNTDEI